MIVLAVACMVIGVLCGQFLFTESVNAAMDTLATLSLNVLILSVGIDIGHNKGVFRKIGRYGLKVMLIPLGVAAGSLLGGLVSGFLFGMPVNQSSAVAAGFGWYSLSAVLLKDLDSAQLGTLAFLTNIFRETLSVLTVPLVAKLVGPVAAVAPGGATSMDTTLPIVAKYTNEETAILSVVSGVTLTALVPVLVPLLYRLPAA